jgi:hypothetical protein
MDLVTDHMVGRMALARDLDDSLPPRAGRAPCSGPGRTPPRRGRIPRLRHRLDPGCDVHRVPEDVRAVLDDVLQADSDQNLYGREPSLCIPFGQPTLDTQRTLGGLQRTVKLHQEAVSGGFALSTPVHRDEGTDDFRVLVEQVKRPSSAWWTPCNLPCR